MHCCLAGIHIEISNIWKSYIWIADKDVNKSAQVVHITARITFIHVFIRSSNIWLSYILSRLFITSLVYLEPTLWPAPSWLVSSVGRALYQYRRGHGFKSRTGLNFFRPYFHYCSSSTHYCEDQFHSHANFVSQFGPRDSTLESDYFQTLQYLRECMNMNKIIFSPRQHNWNNYILRKEKVCGAD